MRNITYMSDDDHDYDDDNNCSDLHHLHHGEPPLHHGGVHSPAGGQQHLRLPQPRGVQGGAGRHEEGNPRHRPRHVLPQQGAPGQHREGAVLISEIYFIV